MPTAKDTDTTKPDDDAKTTKTSEKSEAEVQQAISPVDPDLAPLAGHASTLDAYLQTDEGKKFVADEKDRQKADDEKADATHKAAEKVEADRNKK